MFSSFFEGTNTLEKNRLAESVAQPIHGFEVTNELKARYDSLVEKFRQTFGERQLEFVARAPGRINLIGEHIDYCGGSVLPMAVSQDVIIVGARNKQSSKLHLVNVNDSYEAHEIPVGPEPVVIDRAQHNWTNYFLCGYRGVMEATGEKNPIGLDLCISGTVPAGAGMSSSSALVCAAAMATAQAHGAEFTNQQLAEIAQRSERYVGTESGGMDQAISMLGENGFAMRIDFNPLKATKVKLPEGAVWVVSNCLVESHKLLTADTMYNKRVVECRLASVLFAKLLGVENWATAFPLLKLCELTNQTREQLLAKAQELLPEDPYTIESAAKHLGLESLESSVLADIKAAPRVIAANQHFHLKKRALHVLSEASRVFDFQAVCDRESKENGPEQTQQKLKELGDLMNASHKSCDELFDCSCDALNDLQRICMHVARIFINMLFRVALTSREFPLFFRSEGGALGSRLTGAGWGGCAISLVPVDKVDSFIQHVAANYYDKLPADVKKPEQQHIYLFATQPSSGARALDMRPRANRLSHGCEIM